MRCVRGQCIWDMQAKLVTVSTTLKEATRLRVDSFGSKRASHYAGTGTTPNGMLDRPNRCRSSSFRVERLSSCRPRTTALSQDADSLCWRHPASNEGSPQIQRPCATKRSRGSGSRARGNYLAGLCSRLLRTTIHGFRHDYTYTHT